MEKLKYDEKIEQEVLKEILDALVFIEPKFIPREEFEKMWWNILVELNEKQKKEYLEKKDFNRKDYELFLPDNGLKWKEIAWIIALINKSTFWDKLPESASVKELQIKIIIALNKVKKLKNDFLTKRNWGYKKVTYLRDIEKRFKETYNNLWFDIEDLKDEKTIEKILGAYSIEKQKEYEKELLSIKTKNYLSEYKWKILDNEDVYFEEYLDNELVQHLEESFFEKWVNNLRFWLNIMTSWEQALLTEIKTKNEQISFNTKTENLEKEEKLLRDKIQIEKYKKELDDVRKTWDKEKIAKKENKSKNSWRSS